MRSGTFSWLVLASLLASGLLLSSRGVSAADMMELPAEVRVWYRNPNGSCVQCSIGMAGVWNNVPAASTLLWDTPYGEAVRGGSWPSRVAEYARRRGMAIYNITGEATFAWMEWAAKTGRFAAIGAGVRHFQTEYEKSGGGEAVGLAQICERAARFPQTRITMPRRKLVNQLRIWIRDRQREAARRGTIAGGKYPHLCAMGDVLREICGDGLRVINTNRPLDESIESLKRRSRNATGWLAITDEEAEAVQRWLWQCKQEFLADVDHLTIEYDNLLRDPERQIERVIDYLDIRPTPEQVAAAVAHVDASQRHVRGAGCRLSALGCRDGVPAVQS